MDVTAVPVRTIPVELVESGDMVLVTLDLSAPVRVQIDLMPRRLRLTLDDEEHNVPLPCEVLLSDGCSTARLNNGVLEVKLVRASPAPANRVHAPHIIWRRAE